MLYCVKGKEMWRKDNMICMELKKNKKVRIMNIKKERVNKVLMKYG
jgi:hypothetical protein